MDHPPFKTRALDRAEPSPTDPTSLLPATTRTPTDGLAGPSTSLAGFLASELLTPDLDAVLPHLWLCGRPMPPRPLHRQLLLSRDVALTEDPGLHLVWSRGRIFVKPLPAWLLEPGFWAAHILPSRGEGDLAAIGEKRGGRAELAAAARGFLFTYAALIAYESDFRLAKERGLLPTEITWAGWRAVAGEVVRGHDFGAVAPRYWYGELRLGRLNWVCRLAGGRPLRGYSRVGAHAAYGDRLRDNFAALAAALAYAIVILTAMQVGLATEKLRADRGFQRFSFGFAVFSLVAPVAAGTAILALILVLFVANWGATTRYEARRFAEMGVSPSWTKERRRDYSGNNVI